MPKVSKSRKVVAEALVAANVQVLREQRGWTLRDLAGELGEQGCPVDQSGLWRLERGERRITVDEFVALARAFMVPMDRLLHDPVLAASSDAERKAADTMHRLQELTTRQLAQERANLQEQAQLRAELVSFIDVLPAETKQRVVDLLGRLDHTGMSPNQLNAMVMDEVRFGGPAVQVGTATVRPATPKKRPSKAVAAPRKAAPRKAASKSPSKATSGAKASASTTRKRGTK